MESLLTQLFNPNSATLEALADALETIANALYDYNTMLSALKTTVENLTNFSIAITIITSLSLIVNAVLFYKVIKIDRKIDSLKK